MVRLEDIADLPGFGPSKIDNLKESGYKSIEDLKGVTWEELGEIKGIKSSAKRRAILNFLEENNLREKPSQEANYEKFRSLLEELFQFESADLDFGVYRIMNEKRDRIEEFLDNELQEKVKQELEEFQATEQGEAKERLKEATERIKQDFPNWVDEAGNIDEDAIPEDAQGIMKDRKEEYLEAKKEAQKAEIGENTEAAIYQDLYRFFKRYYKDGDFIPQRRAASQEKYAIPYNGEEVTLHWANKDQYFIKTGEQFKDYKFRKNSYEIEFKLHDAHVETGNQKGENKYFVLRGREPVEQEGRQLTVHFEYRSLREEDYNEYSISESSRTKSRDLQEKIEQRILSEVSSQLLDTLTQETDRDNSDSTVLQRHLKNYRTKNKSDYFIHKNLGGFLRQELEFYLKNEVFSWKEITDERGELPLHVRARLNAIENIATDIINFVSEIEDFQKKLYEKKKFIVNTEICVSLDRVPDELYPEIIDNEDQIKEWIEVYGLENSEPDTFLEDDLDSRFMMDTKHFSKEFKHRLRTEIEPKSEIVHGDNQQVLSLLKERYEGSIKGIYIDPPYNTGSEFVYKDNFRHSSWLSMMESRLELAKELLTEDGGIFISIDYHEMPHLRKLCDQIFGEENFRNTITVRRGVKNVQAQFDEVENLTRGYEYVVFYSKNENTRFSNLFKELDEEKPGSWNNHWRGTDRPTMRYPLFGQEPDTGQWRWSKERSMEAIENYKMLEEKFGAKGEKIPQEKIDSWYKENVEEDEKLDLLRYNSKNDTVEHYVPPKNEEMLTDSWLDISPYGSNDLKSKFGENPYDNPKPVDLVKRIARFICDDKDRFLDFFAGSGTSAEAIIELNDERSMNIEYIAVEMADYFDYILKPRIKKAVYSDNWVNGESRSDTGRSHAVKSMKIENYEDSLNNLNTGEGQMEMGDFTHDQLEYFLKFGVKGPSLLHLDGLKDPFNYQMEIRESDESKNLTIDLVETFNYLLGLNVRQIRRYENQDREYRVVKGDKDTEDVAVVWRPVQDGEGKEFFEKERDFLTSEVIGDEDVLYINYDSALPDTKSIEKAFQNRMWE